MLSLRLFLIAALVAGSLAGGPVAAQTPALTYVEGTVRDTAGAVIPSVCVTFGPPTTCSTWTNSGGYYRFDGIPPNPDAEWEIFFSKEGYVQKKSARFIVTGPTRVDATLVAGTTVCARPSTVDSTVYLPNITKTLGGPDGWQTPFIVQNVDRFRATSLEILMYAFSDGSLVAKRDVCALPPGNSYALVPNLMSDLPDWTQYAVVVRSYMTDVVAVVNEHAGTGARAEAASYVGATSGSTSVFLPNITRRFFGYVTPFIIQNLGTATTTATASFVSFDGTRTATVFRTITPGRSQFIDPNFEPSLVDGTQYAVTVTASQPLSVVVNTHNDAPSVAQPVVYSTNGLTRGAATVYGPYAVKGVPGVGSGVSTIVVQNLGTTAVTPTLTFTPLGGGTAVTKTGPSVQPKGAWAYDPRFANGSEPSGGSCEGQSVGPGCIPNGEYTFTASVPSGEIATVVNVIGSATATGYAAIAAPSAWVMLPNVTRTLGGPAGWTTPLFIQSAGATGATLSWYRFSDGALVTTQTVTLPAGGGIRVDPRTVPGLSDNTQYSVVAQSDAGELVAIVHELNFQGGDGAMTYEGFAR